MDYVCAESWQIGMLGSVFLFGIVLGCALVTRKGDTKGRRPVYLAGFILNLCGVLPLVFSRSPIVVQLCLLTFGISMTARYYVGYTFSLEFQPRETQVIVSIVQFASESITYVLVIAYYRFVSNWYIPLQIPNIILSIFGILWIYRMPETPKFLLAQKQYGRAREVFGIIAR